MKDISKINLSVNSTNPLNTQSHPNHQSAKIPPPPPPTQLHRHIQGYIQQNPSKFNPSPTLRTQCDITDRVFPCMWCHMTSSFSSNTVGVSMRTNCLNVSVFGLLRLRPFLGGTRTGCITINPGRERVKALHTTVNTFLFNLKENLGSDLAETGLATQGYALWWAAGLSTDSVLAVWDTQELAQLLCCFRWFWQPTLSALSVLLGKAGLGGISSATLPTNHNHLLS